MAGVGQCSSNRGKAAVAVISNSMNSAAAGSKQSSLRGLLRNTYSAVHTHTEHQAPGLEKHYPMHLQLDCALLGPLGHRAMRGGPLHLGLDAGTQSCLVACS